jgi:t-SNARE complex subunit (syntaxin)
MNRFTIEPNDNEINEYYVNKARKNAKINIYFIIILFIIAFVLCLIFG